MKDIQSEPIIAVGLMTGVKQVSFQLSGEFLSKNGQRFLPGSYQAVEDGHTTKIRNDDGHLLEETSEIELVPKNASSNIFTLADVMIGIDFHWQRKEEQSFQGTLKIFARPNQGLIVVNRIPVESYLTSVISSEMSASCPPELLKAHAVISRSWLLAQLSNQKSEADRQQSAIQFDALRQPQSAIEIVRWYDRENHTDFDVCADDHCQRYQGITKAFSPAVFDAIKETRGLALVYDDEICDARFSKCCGGMTENYRAAWEDRDIPYLSGVYDGLRLPVDIPWPLDQETAAEQWIMNSPPVYCNTTEPILIQQILPAFDQETPDFFRWEVTYEQDELQAIIQRKLNLELGAILALEPLKRGVSGRIVKLRIVGERASIVIGKELEIRRALSPTHLYSSAFVVRSEGQGTVPRRFRLIGAGWGHGVGLCQIGAAVMAQQGNSYREVLAHYYRGSSFSTLYDGRSND